MTLSQKDKEDLIAAGVPLTGAHDKQSITVPIDFGKISEIIDRALDDNSDPKIRAAINPPVTGRDIKLRRIALSHIGNDGTRKTKEHRPFDQRNSSHYWAVIFSGLSLSTRNFTSPCGGAFLPCATWGITPKVPRWRKL